MENIYIFSLKCILFNYKINDKSNINGNNEYSNWNLKLYSKIEFVDLQVESRLLVGKLRKWKEGRELKEGRGLKEGRKLK